MREHVRSDGGEVADQERLHRRFESVDSGGVALDAAEDQKRQSPEHDGVHEYFGDERQHHIRRQRNEASDPDTPRRLCRR